MHLRMQRALADVFASLLSFIFKRLWRLGEIPSDRRMMSIVPVFKKDRKFILESYRSVSLTSVTGKIMKVSSLGTDFWAHEGEGSYLEESAWIDQR